MQIKNSEKNPVGEALGFLRGELRNALEKYELLPEVNEIRLRRSLALSVTLGTRNVFLTADGRAAASGGLICAPTDLEYAADRLCEGSVYRHMPTLCEGYAVTSGGLRVGICGRCVYIDNKPSAIGAFTSINIRIPRAVRGCADALARRFSREVMSTLIYSPPGIGKTTFIRDLALTLSKRYRVSVIDEKCEIFPPESNFSSGGGMLDILFGYRKAHGLELATRTLSPEVIVCDEIGLSDDTEAILSMQSSGVSLIATVHASQKSDLANKPNIARLISNGVFSIYCGLFRRPDDGVEVSLDT